MRINCVSADCREHMDRSWDFCPYCGTDNRPPARKTPIPDHRHHFLNRSGHCMVCGEEADEPYNMKGRTRRRLAFVIILFGLLILAWVANMIFAHLHWPALFSDWIRSWWSSTTILRVRLPFIYTRELGWTLCFWLSLIGIIVVAAGFMLARKSRMDDLFDDDLGGCLGFGILGWW